MAGHSSGRIDDTLLVREAQRGNRAAFEELVRHYDQAVLRLAMHLTGSEHEAQDIYQDAFLKAYKSVGNFRFECSFYTWIYRIVTNLCLDHLRKKQVRKEDAPVAVDAASGTGHDVLGSPDGASTATGASLCVLLLPQVIQAKIGHDAIDPGVEGALERKFPTLLYAFRKAS